MRKSSLGLLLFLWCACNGTAAPAPVPRAARPVPRVVGVCKKDMVGDWVMTWGGGDWNVSLSAFGTYTASRGNGSLWIGTWHLSGPGDFHVSEAWVDGNGQNGVEMSWAGVWQRGEDGRFDTRYLSGVVKRPDGSTSTTIIMRRVR